MLTDKDLLDKLDPYGNLEFSIGTGDDFVCFDLCVDYARRRIALGATVNCDTGGFIENFAPSTVVPFEEAEAIARDWTGRALDWAADGDTPLRLDLKGWNQDPTYFYRSVRWITEQSAAYHKRPARRVRKWSQLFYKGR
jgi:hypothetical protein